MKPRIEDYENKPERKVLWDNKKQVVIVEGNNFNILKNMSLAKVSCIIQNNNEVFIKNESSCNRLSLQSTWLVKNVLILFERVY